MASFTIHPEVLPRINKLGKRYQKLHAATVRTENEIGAFCARTGPIIEKFMAFNDHLLHLINDQKIPQSLLQQQITTSDDMAELGTNFSPMLSNLIYGTPPKAESIYAFQHVLESTLQALQLLNNDKEGSIAQTIVLEQQLQIVEHTHVEIRTQLNECTTIVQKMQAMLKRTFN